MVAPTTSARPDTAEAVRRARLSAVLGRDYRFIWRLLRRVGVPRDSIDDATQQVFLILAERLDDVTVGSERSFAYGTALRVARSTRRRDARESPADEQPESTSPWPAPDELSDQKRARDVLDRVLGELDEDLREVFVLFELEGVRTREIAELTHVPLGTVASRLRRAREAFRALVAAEAQKRGSETP